MKFIKFLFVFFLLLFVLIIFFHDFFLKGYLFFDNDYIHYAYPIKNFMIENFKQNVKPLWNPYRYSGHPIYASIISGSYYPIEILFFFLPVEKIITIISLMHLVLGGIFFYLFLRTFKLKYSACVFGALTFAYAPFFIVNAAVDYNVLRTVIWLPLIFYAINLIIFQKQYNVGTLIFSVSFSIMVLAGHMQFSFYGFIFFISYYLFLTAASGKENLKKNIICLILFLIMFLGLVSIQFFPAFELASRASRTGGVSFKFASAYSLYPNQILNALIPDIFREINVNYSTYFHFCGAITFLLALFSLKKIRKNSIIMFFAASAFISFLISLGKYTPLFYFFYRWFPGFNLFRGPQRFLIVFVFSLVTLGVFGFSEMLNKRKIFLKLLVITALITVLFVYFLYFYQYYIAKGIYFAFEKIYSSGYISINADINIIRRNILSARFYGSLRELSYFLILLSCLFAAVLLIPKYAKTAVFLIIFLNLFQIYGVNKKYINLKTPEMFKRINPAINFYKTLPDKNFRIAGYGYFRFQENMANNIESAEGYGGIVLKNYSRFTSFIETGEINEKFALGGVHIKNTFSNLLHYLNIRYVTVPKEKEYNKDNYEQVFEMENFHIVKNKRNLGYAVLYSDFEFYDDLKKILNQIEENFEENKNVLFINKNFKENIPLTPQKSGVKTTVKHIKINNNEKKFYFKGSGILFVSEIYYPGWEAYVNGEKAEITPALDCLMGIPVISEGENEVYLRFNPKVRIYGIWVTILTLAAYALFLTVSLKKKANTVKGLKTNLLYNYLKYASLSLSLVRSQEAKIIRSFKPANKILDIGCGDGVFARHISDEKIYLGIDLSIKELKRARKSGAYKYLVRCDAKKLPFKKESFNTVISNCVIEHIKDINNLLKEINWVIKSGGCYIFTTHTANYGKFLYFYGVLKKAKLRRAASFYAFAVNKIFKHYSCYSGKKWFKILYGCGFSNMEYKYYLSKELMNVFDKKLIFSLPSFISKKIFGRWKIFPSKTLALVLTLKYNYLYEQETDKGAGICITAVKK